MPEPVFEGLELFSRLLLIVGASALVIGFVVGTTQFFQQMRQQGTTAAMASYRKSLGRTVLIGLEILVVATIINTITVDLSLEGMGLLAVMVMVRTMLGWTTVLEISGRWPWQK
jgi:uncharacterized membrane protein